MTTRTGLALAAIFALFSGVVVRAQNVEGETVELDGTDLTARCVLHETDHCEGIVFLDRMSALKREMAKRKIKRLQKTGKWD